jgi:tetratricopeptide (TPR) repeat protein
MWAEHDYVRPYHIKWTGLTWQEASDYCSAVKIGGLSGWRLPTADEVKEIKYTRHGVVTINTGRAYSYPCDYDAKKTCWILHGDWTQPYDQDTLKIDIGTEEWSASIWTSTPSATDQKSALVVSPELTFVPILRTKTQATHLSAIAALCVRPMEPEILQIAKDAQVGAPVPDLQTLKANVPLTKARLAYQAGQYQESITQAQNALSIKPGLQTAYWGLGISYGMLGQWDLAIANLNSASKLGKDDEVKAALQWAVASQKAAKKGEKPKIKGKDWKSPEWKGPPWS